MIKPKVKKMKKFIFDFGRLGLACVGVITIALSLVANAELSHTINSSENRIYDFAGTADLECWGTGIPDAGYYYVECGSCEVIPYHKPQSFPGTCVP